MAAARKRTRFYRPHLPGSFTVSSSSGRFGVGERMRRKTVVGGCVRRSREKIQAA
jgi:hypothetical protein